MSDRSRLNQLVGLDKRSSEATSLTVSKESRFSIRISPVVLEIIWCGVSVENCKHGLPRIQHLRDSPASIRFLSVEPLLEDLGAINLDGIHWVIVVGESGAGARPMEESWVENIRKQCLRSKIPFFFKQWGGVRKSENGRELVGRTFDEMPLSHESFG